MDDDEFKIEIPNNYESYGIPNTSDDENYEQNESHGSFPHKDKPITNIEISPNGKYLVTYSKKDCSIIGWDISGTGDTDIRRLEPDSIVETGSKRVNQICISDDKKLAYIYNDSKFIGKQYLCIHLIAINEYSFNS